MKEKILIVDDEKSIIELLTMSLEREGFEVFSASNGEKAIELTSSKNPDLIVLDIMLPDIDGFEICKKLREVVNIPIIMLTARTEDVDKVVGLEIGADDYITKPFNPRVLIARIKAVLRRTKEKPKESTGDAQAVIKAGDLKIDCSRYLVTRSGKQIKLTPKEFAILSLLAKKPDQIFTRQVILEQVWGYDYYGDSRTVDVHLQRLRKKIEKNPAKPKIIETVRGVGYRIKRK